MRRGDLQGIRVAEAMHDGVVTCARETPLSVVARLMADEQVQSVVVATGPEGLDSPWGVVSDLDLVAAARVRELDTQSAGGSAVSPPLVVGSDESLEQAARLMTEHAASQLLVVEPVSGRPAGLLSALDVANALVATRRA